MAKKESSNFPFIVLNGWVKCSKHQHKKEGEVHAEAAPTAQPQSVPQQMVHAEISKEHADKFGYLLVQGFDGRIEPMNTQALDVLRKLAKKEKWGEQTQPVVLSININPMAWMNDKIIKIGTKGGEELKKKPKKTNEDGYTSMMNLFVTDAMGMPKFILEEDFNTAFRKTCRTKQL